MNHIAIIKELDDRYNEECEYDPVDPWDFRSHLRITGHFYGKRSKIIDLLNGWDLRDDCVFHEAAGGSIAVDENEFGVGYADAWPKTFGYILENGERILSRDWHGEPPPYCDTFFEDMPLSTISCSLGSLITTGALKITATSWRKDIRFEEKLTVRADGSVEKRFQEFEDWGTHPLIIENYRLPAVAEVVNKKALTEQLAKSQSVFAATSLEATQH
jgi:hypothetical protein